MTLTTGKQTRVRNNTVRTLAMQQAMTSSPQTYEDLVRVSGLGKRAVMRWMKAMRSADAAHISGWAPDSTGRLFVAAWRFGQGTDAPRPGLARKLAPSTIEAA